MKTTFCIFVLIATLALQTSALYSTQIGKFDWSKRNIGELDFALLKNYKIAFKSENNVIGSVSSSRGVVEWSKKFDDTQVLIKQGDAEFLVYDFKASAINLIDYIQGINKVSFRVKQHIPNVIDFGLTLDHERQVFYIAMLSHSELVILKEETVVTSKTPSKDHAFVGLSTDSTHANVLSKSNSQVCLQRVPLSGAASEEPKCLSFNQHFTHSFEGDFVTIQGESKTAVFNIYKNEAKEIKFGELFASCGGHVAKEGANFIVSAFDANKLTLNKASTVEVHSNNEYRFTCAHNPKSGEKKLVLVNVANQKTINVRGFNLASNEASHFLAQRELDSPLTETRDVYVSLAEDDVAVLLQTATLQTVYFTKTNKVVWRREDSLAEIRKIEYFDISTFSSEDSNIYFESLETGDSLASIPKNLVLRLTSQVQSVVKAINYYIELIAAGRISSLWTATSDEKFDIEYGLNKIILAVTERNTVFGLESNSGTTKWERQIPTEWRVEGIFKKDRRQGIKDAVLYLAHRTEKRSQLVLIDPNDGKVISVEDFSYVPEKIVRAQFDKFDALLLIKNTEEVGIYPSSLKERNDIESLINGIVIYWNKKTEIVGYQINSYHLYPVWNFVLPKDEVVFRTANWAYDHEESSFTGIIPEDMKVIYKFVDSNNFALLTRSEQGGSHLNLYILNGITGRVLSSETQQYVDFNHPINLIFDENAVFVTYFNREELYYEFWITEFYHTHIESSIRVLVEKYLLSRSFETQGANYDLAEGDFTIFTKKYYFSPGVKSLSVVQTKRGITKKNLIVVTSNDQVYSLDRGLVSTRRQYVPEGKQPISDASSFMSSELPPFHPLIPINTLKYIFYYQKFTGLNTIASVPTQFESSALLAVYGHDLVFSRFAPEKEYDMLNEDFNYLYLLASFIIVVVAVVAVKRFEFRSRIEKIFK